MPASRCWALTLRPLRRSGLRPRHAQSPGEKVPCVVFGFGGDVPRGSSCEHGPTTGPDLGTHVDDPSRRLEWPGDPGLVPDRLGDRKPAVRAEHQEAVERAANQRSWVTASTVPSKASRPSCSASALARSRLSVGSSSSSSVAPPSSSSRICSRACWPPDSVSNGCSAQLQLVAGQRGHGVVAQPARAPSSRSRTGCGRPVRGGHASGRTGRARPARPAGPPRCARRIPPTSAAAGNATCPSRWSRAPRPARRTRSPHRTGSSARSVPAARR